MDKHENWRDVESISQDLSEGKESTWTISFENGSKLRFVGARVEKIRGMSSMAVILDDK